MKSSTDITLPTEPVVFDLTLSHVAQQKEESMQTLRKAAAGIHLANAANVFYRFILGQQLVVIQQKQLWRGDPAILTWHQWLTNKFPDITDFGRSTAYGAIKLAKSENLSELSEEKLRSFRSLRNAIRLATMEKKGQKIAPHVVEASRTMRTDQFQVVAGDGDHGAVDVLTETTKGAKYLTAIVSLLGKADDQALGNLWEAIEKLFLLAGGNPTDLCDAIDAAIRAELEAQNVV